MRNPQGYAYSITPFKTVERDTFTCGHCNTIQFVEPNEKPEDIGGMCKLCMKLICSKCVSLGVCDPFEEKLLREETSYHSRRYFELCK